MRFMSWLRFGPRCKGDNDEHDQQVFARCSRPRDRRGSPDFSARKVRRLALTSRTGRATALKGGVHATGFRGCPSVH